MELLGSRITDDEKLVLTHYICMTCGKRLLVKTENPRYVPAPKETTAVPHYRMPVLDEQAESERDAIQLAIKRAGITVKPPLSNWKIHQLLANKPNGIFANLHNQGTTP